MSALEPVPARFVPVCELAAGGIGKVDLVLRREGAFERLFALKRLHPPYRSDPEFLTMFLDEGRLAGLLQHPNAVSVLDVGQDAHGPYLVMEFVDGVSVSEILSQAHGRPLPALLAVQIIKQAAQGLHAAHELRSLDGEELGLVHRDVSPQNVLVGYDGIVKVTDFGIAKALGRGTKTDGRGLKGKRGYMSPEQLRYESIDRRSDLFCLGVVLYELLAGQRLYDDDAPSKILNDPPPDIGEVRSDLPPALVELSIRVLAKDPGLRPASAKLVADELSEIERALLDEQPDRESLGEFVTRVFAEQRSRVRQRHDAAVAHAITQLAADANKPRRRWVALSAAIATAALIASAGTWLARPAPTTASLSRGAFDRARALTREATALCASQSRAQRASLAETISAPPKPSRVAPERHQARQLRKRRDKSDQPVIWESFE